MYFLPPFQPSKNFMNFPFLFKTGVDTYCPATMPTGKAETVFVFLICKKNIPFYLKMQPFLTKVGPQIT